MRPSFWIALSSLAVAACSSSGGPGSGGDAGAPLPTTDDACAGPCPQSSVKHLVIFVQENHTFDSHFGKYCTAAAGSNPTCNDGPACCEAIPAADPTGVAPALITDQQMGGRDPDHTQACENAEIDDGKMDKFASGASCSDPGNVAAGDGSILQPYWDLAAKGALADRYFQPVSGQSSSNDMYLARAQFAFLDNTVSPKSAVGVGCGIEAPQQELTGETIGDLLTKASVPWAWFSEGYKAMSDAVAAGQCATAPDDCPLGIGIYPCVFDPSDVPFEYYASTRDTAATMKDLSALEDALDHGGLPAVSFVKSLGYKSEHPGARDKLSDGVAFVTGLVAKIEASRYRDDTLVLVTYDEGGGYYDHVAPPPASAVDHQPYGTRVPLLAIGPFARSNYVSHVTMEHSSIVKFVEWNWLGGATGQLAGRDAVVANLGSLLDPAKTGVAVPE